MQPQPHEGGCHSSASADDDGASTLHADHHRWRPDHRGWTDDRLRAGRAKAYAPSGEDYCTRYAAWHATQFGVMRDSASIVVLLSCVFAATANPLAAVCMASPMPRIASGM